MPTPPTTTVTAAGQEYSIRPLTKGEMERAQRELLNAGEIFRLVLTPAQWEDIPSDTPWPELQAAGEAVLRLTYLPKAAAKN